MILYSAVTGYLGNTGISERLADNPIGIGMLWLFVSLLGGYVFTLIILFLIRFKKRHWGPERTDRDDN